MINLKQLIFSVDCRPGKDHYPVCTDNADSTDSNAMKTTNYYSIINSHHVHGLQHLRCVCLYVLCVLGVFISLFFVSGTDITQKKDC